KNYCVGLLIGLFSLSASASYGQNYDDVDTIAVSEIHTKKNPFPTRPPVFFIYKKQLHQSFVRLKVNYWKTKTNFGINLNQAAFSDNWSGGGVTSVALGSVLNYKAEYNKDGKNFTSEV